MKTTNTKRNVLTDPVLASRFASAAQDMWHYCTLIAPIKGAESTFAGCGGYRGLPGLVRTYEDLIGIVQGWQRLELPAFADIEIVSPEYINTTGELRHQARIIFRALETVADENGIDAYNGTFKVASVSNLI